MSKPAPSSAEQCACGAPRRHIVDSPDAVRCRDCPEFCWYYKHYPCEDEHVFYAVPSSAERCAQCGHGAHGTHPCPGCLMGCHALRPEAASEVLTPCPVYPCPCACHRQGPHVPTDECDDAALRAALKKAEEEIQRLLRLYEDTDNRRDRAVIARSAAEARAEAAEEARDELKRVIRDMDYSYNTNDWATIRMGTFRTLKALAHGGEVEC
jgi:hypothetical protein